ncbi:hypothetical protein C8Q76DRAFT_706765 [Earliella scabrosa]|nr:hypothetical protein C8Q76DRAFT_706765 [Earliella scabrosa]
MLRKIQWKNLLLEVSPLAVLAASSLTCVICPAASHHSSLGRIQVAWLLLSRIVPFTRGPGLLPSLPVWVTTAFHDSTPSRFRLVPGSATSAVLAVTAIDGR